MANHRMAAKNEEELAKLEEGVAAQLEESSKEEPEVQSEEEQTTEEASPATEEETPEEEETEPEEAAESSEEESEPEEGLKDKTRQRIENLSKSKKEALEEIERLKAELEAKKAREEVEKPLEEIKETYGKEPEPKSKLPWSSEVPEDPRKVAREEIEKEKRLSYIGSDAEVMEQTYPELNPDSESYDAELAKDIYDDFKTVFLADDSKRLRDLASRRMKAIYKAREVAAKKAAEEAKVSTQHAEEAPPANVAPPKKKASTIDMVKRAESIEDLEKLERKLGVSDRYN